MENLNALNNALHELGLLSSITDARKEYLNELRNSKIRNSRSLPSLVSILPAPNARRIEANSHISKEHLDGLEIIPNGNPLKINRAKTYNKRYGAAEYPLVFGKRNRFEPYPELRIKNSITSPERMRKSWRSSSASSASSCCSSIEQSNLNPEEFNPEDDRHHFEPLSLITLNLRRKADKSRREGLLPRSKSLEDLKGPEKKVLQTRSKEDPTTKFRTNRGSGDLSSSEIDSIALRFGKLFN